ncbi:hypothetical protein VP02_27315 [Pseudomonas ogarae]|uniref:Uncharacterized protein n=1 Tax=Pseudomonas kilonensis TaxID=132476 RepID=A0A0F4XHB7_9PSED|nr:hypothetical protein [Pseudomonas ogarae]KKA04613.1 hypothetical protein VP02_27315 [Pseudomonas ogarae]
MAFFVTNSGTLTYCGDLHKRPWGFIVSSNYSCDYHRIADVGSGGKLSRDDNIGRFGIDFVSTYQVTNHPEIRSSGFKLTLHPDTLPLALFKYVGSRFKVKVWAQDNQDPHLL